MELTPENNVNANGTASNGNAYHEGEKRLLNNGNDTIRMSHLSKLPAVDIEFNDVTYSVQQSRKESKMILKGVTGQFKSGELTAILGPSGAGKSTLLNILAGYKCTDIGGSIHINGLPRDMQQFKKLSCYIMQNDLIQPKLTVFEAMTFATELKLGKNKSLSEKQNAIEEILSMLRMTEARDTMTDALSGGQKKRLMIALELVHNSPVIFLDEPTTGLDDLSSNQCIDLLQKLSLLGRTVVCSIHTPSAKVLKKFDHIYVLAGGQCSYRGAADNILPFLKSIGLECPKYYNPADFLIEISSGEYGFDVTERTINCVDTKLPSVPISRTKYEFELDQIKLEVSWFNQFSALLRRKILQIYRNKNYICLQVTLHIFLGLIIGMLFFNMGNDGSKTVFNVCFCLANVIMFLYIPMMPVLLHFPIELRTIKREHFNRWYKISAYYWVLTVVNIPLQITMALIYLSITYFITGQPLEFYRCCMFSVTCFICSFIAESIGYNIASLFNVVNSMFVGPTSCCPLILFAVQGFGDTTPLSLFQFICMYSSYIRYGLEALLVSIYGYNRPRMFCPPEEVYCHFNSPNEVFYRIIGTGHIPNYWFDISMLLLILVICKVVFYYLLRQRVQPNHTFQMLNLVGRFVKSHFTM